jgi:hypothetical protein
MSKRATRGAPAAPTVGTRPFTRRAVRTRRRVTPRRAPRRSGLDRRLRAALRRIPRAAWVCAVVAILNAASWSIVSPPFEVPDEPSHYAYAQLLAETGHLPQGSTGRFPSAEARTLADLHYLQVRFFSQNGTISSRSEQRQLERDLALPYSRTGSVETGVSATEPPLYYALQTIPYGLAAGGTVLDRLALMRLLSALMGGLTALFAFLFLREALPGAPWAWTVGGLGVALAPLLGLMSGAVNPDALLYAVSAALFYCLARGFRRGLGPGVAIALGAVLAAGFLTQLRFIGLLPGALLGLLALCIREGHTSRRNAYRCFALTTAVGASPILLYIAVNALLGRPEITAISTAVALFHRGGSVLKEVGYIWQLYLPRLPGMSPDFHGFLPPRVAWFDGLVGRYGWVDTTFPSWVYDLALVPAGLIAALFIRALHMYRGELRRRLTEAVVYLAIGLGVLILIGDADYVGETPGEFAEPRYLLPMLALWGAVLALAARGAGRRWGPVVGACIVVLILAHNIFSQLLVISRYYG